MTRSEQVCNEIGSKFFCKDFVYENLKYYNDSNNRVELCDALFEHGGMYLAFQIKERAAIKGTKSTEDWLRDVVYRQAVEQIKTTVDAIKDKHIQVNDLYHQKVDINNKNLIFPLILFDNPDVNDYNRSVDYEGIIINVMSISDYQAMMEVLVLPYDIFYYLQERSKWLTNSGGLPHFVFGDNENVSIVANIKTEKDFANFFKHYAYDGNTVNRNNALRVLALIGTFRERQIKKDSQYKTILRILQYIEPQLATGFMERFDYAWKVSCENKFDYSRAIQLTIDEKKTSIIFFSLGTSPFPNKRYYEILCDAKQLQHKSDSVLLICFIGDSAKTCQIDWFYIEQEYVDAPQALEFYTELGMFNGGVDRETYEEICNKWLSE